MTPTEARQQLEAFKADADKQAAVMDNTHPRHKSVMAEREQLYEAAYPDLIAEQRAERQRQLEQRIGR